MSVITAKVCARNVWNAPHKTQNNYTASDIKLHCKQHNSMFQASSSMVSALVKSAVFTNQLSMNTTPGCVDAKML